MLNPLTMKAPKENGTLILRYRGRQYLDLAKTISDRLYDVLSPIPGHKKDEMGSVPTFTLSTLKSKGWLK